jgi:CubicO group peptidase (beta-lactamase class C family)
MKFVPLATLAALLVWAPPLIAQDDAGSKDDARLAALAARAREQAGAPALGLVVIRAVDGADNSAGDANDAPQYETHIAVDGVRLFGEDSPVTSTDQWHWGSNTKSMTATLVARLVEKGVVSWDQTVGELLGDAVPDMQESYRDVTFRQLLSHRAGLAANIAGEIAIEFGQSAADPIADRLKWVRLALSQTPVGPKEETFSYSNNGYIVAGAMLEAATGESWETLIRREVFAPLGMTGAGFGAPKGPDPLDQPRGHVSVNGVDQPVPPDSDNPAALGPAGRVHMPLADMARYLSAHAQRRPDFLSEESYNTLHTPPFEGNYAMGWVDVSPTTRWHNGSNTMWYAEMAINLDDGTAAAVVVNDGDIASVQPAVRALLQALMEK